MLFAKTWMDLEIAFLCEREGRKKEKGGGIIIASSVSKGMYLYYQSMLGQKTK